MSDLSNDSNGLPPLPGQIHIEEYTVAGKTIEFMHSAVNKDMHLFINGFHDPDVCPECIRPGTLVES